MIKVLLDEIRDGFILAFRRWPMMLTLAGLITLSTMVLSFALADVLSEVYVLRGTTELRERHAVFFTAYYPEGGEVSHVDDETVRYLMNLIDQQQAYTSIVYNMALDNPDFAGGYPTLILFGDVVPNLFPDMHLCIPTPCAVRGARVTADGVDTLNVGGIDISAEQTLPRGTTFFDVNAAGLPLDYRIVVRAPTSVIPILNPIEREELITRAVFLNPTDSMVYTFIAGAAPIEGCPDRWKKAGGGNHPPAFCPRGRVGGGSFVVRVERRSALTWILRAAPFVSAGLPCPCQ